MNDNLHPNLAQILESELAPGERILWRGRPSLAHLIHFWLVLVLSGLLAFVGIGGGVYIMHLPGFHRLSLSPLPIEIMMAVVTSLAILFPMTVWLITRQTVYAVTDRRAVLIHAAVLRRSVRSFTGEQLVRVVRNESRQGSGDIFFERRVGFLGLTNARAVADLLRQTYQATRPA